jgi:hypothetical protein
VDGCCERGDEPSGSCATELVKKSGYFSDDGILTVALCGTSRCN